MTNYDDSYIGVHTVYTKENLQMTLGEVLERQKKKQIRIAETEKYPHVTFFFSGGRLVFFRLSFDTFKNFSSVMLPSWLKKSK